MSTCCPCTRWKVPSVDHEGISSIRRVFLSFGNESTILFHQLHHQFIHHLNVNSNQNDEAYGWRNEDIGVSVRDSNNQETVVATNLQFLKDLVVLYTELRSMLLYADDILLVANNKKEMHQEKRSKMYIDHSVNTIVWTSNFPSWKPSNNSTIPNF